MAAKMSLEMEILRVQHWDNHLVHNMELREVCLIVAHM